MSGVDSGIDDLRNELCAVLAGGQKKVFVKQILICIALFCSLISCSKTKELRFELGGNGYQETTLEPERILPSVADIYFEGQCDCEVSVEISKITRITFQSGTISESEKDFEWFPEPHTISIHSEGCSQNSYLKIKYHLVHDLF